MNTTFIRNAGAAEADPSIRMPADLIRASTTTMSIGELLGRLEQFTTGELSPEQFPWATRFVMGFPLPSWQRPLVWTLEQKTRFITSIWCGVEIGSYLINDVYEFMPDGTLRKFSDILLDGQQRLSTIEEYVKDGFAIPDATGTPRLWSQLPSLERRRFAVLQFSRATVRTWDEKLLRLAYDLRAFGGTAHTEDQRALGD